MGKLKRGTRTQQGTLDPMLGAAVMLVRGACERIQRAHDCDIRFDHMSAVSLNGERRDLMADVFITLFKMGALFEEFNQLPDKITDKKE